MQTIEYRAVVYKYATGVKSDFDDHAMTQLRMAHDFYNELVAICKHHEEQKALAWREHPKVEAAASQVDDLVEQCDEVAETWRKSKIKTKDRKGDPEVKATLTTLRAELKEMRSTLKECKSEAYEVLLPRFEELNTEQKAIAKATRQKYSAIGLYWGTYNLVWQQWQRAVQSVARKRKAGQAADLRFRRWQGEGQLTVQLQREANAPQRTPQLLASDESKWRNSVTMPDMTDGKQRAPLTIRTGTDSEGEIRYLTIEVIWHRPIPHDGDITEIKISRRRVAGNTRLWVEATVKLPVPTESNAPGICGIDTGWRVLPDGSIRVAVWRAKRNKSIKVPHHLTEAIYLDGEGGEVRIPARIVRKWKHTADLRSIRDKNMEQLRSEVKDSPEILEYLREGERIDQWRSPNRFAALTMRMRESRTPVAAKLEAWRKQDRHLWEWEANERQKVVDWRSDCFRVVAALLCGENLIIAVEEPYVAKVIRRKEDATVADDATRTASVLGAPSSLIMAIKSAASSRGVAMSVHPGKWTTITHSACGHVNEPGAGTTSLLIKCAGCGETYDQDTNAAWMLVELASAEVAAPEQELQTTP